MSDEKATRLATRAVVSDIECECVRVNMGDGQRWYDTRPMVDPRERAPQELDMATEGLQWALDHGVAQRHAEHAYLVRITAPAA